MDIDFYEVPGLNAYVCTTEIVRDNFLGRMIGHDEKYLMFSNLNDYCKQGEINSLNVYTTNEVDKKKTDFLNKLDFQKATYEGERLRQGIGTGLLGGLAFFTMNPLIGALAGYKAANAYTAHKAAEYVSNFRDAAEDLDVSASDEITQLSDFYTELDLDAKFKEMNNQVKEWGFWEKVWGNPNDEHKDAFEQIQSEILSDLNKMHSKAFELYEDSGNIALNYVGQVYSAVAAGDNIRLFTPVPMKGKK